MKKIILNSVPSKINNRKTTKKTLLLDAKTFLGLTENNSEYYNGLASFAERFNSFRDKEKIDYKNFLDLGKSGEKMTNFIEVKEDVGGNEYVYCKYSKRGADLGVKVMVDDVMKKLLLELHNGTIKIDFTLQDIENEFNK